MKKIEFTPVNRFAEPCACCERPRSLRGLRGVRVDIEGGEPRGGFTFYYCDTCIDRLAKAKEHP